MNIRSTVLACITFLVGIAIVITYVGQQDRYAIFSQDKAIFVFDRKNATLNYCTADNCQLITPHASGPEMAAAMSGIPSQMAIINGQPVMVQGVAAPMMTTASQVGPQTSLQIMLPAGMQPMVAAAAAAKDGKLADAGKTDTAPKESEPDDKKSETEE
jgi:hypothetical protein